MAYDYEYERNGVSNLFMLFAPLEGWRRGGGDGPAHQGRLARVVQQLVDLDYPDKDRIVLVMDNLNTHHPASLYAAFPPEEARRIAERLEIHYTPKPLATRLDRVAGSWLNMAEIELGVLTRQCLDRRIPDQKTLQQETQTGKVRATGTPLGWTGASPRRTPASNLSRYTHHSNDDRLLVPFPDRFVNVGKLPLTLDS